MVNRETNFNRKKQKRGKVIRDLLRGRITNRLKRFEKHVVEKQLTKKEQKKEKRLAQIYKDIGVNSTDFLKRKILKRRNKKSNSNNTEMHIDS